MAGGIIHLTDDLIFASRVSAEARSRGIDCVQARNPEILSNMMKSRTLGCLMIDLAHPGLDLLKLMGQCRELDPRPRVVAYGSHVDVQGLKAAREAGCDDVMPRSRFVEEMPSSLNRWVGGSATTDTEAKDSLSG